MFKEEPIKNAKAAEDFLHLVFTSYIIVAAENVQSASKTNHVIFVTKQIVSKFCDLSIGKESNHTNSDCSSLFEGINDLEFAVAWISCCHTGR